MHKGKELEEKFAKDGSVPDPASTDNAEFKCVLSVLRDSIKSTDKTKYTRMAAKCKGVSEETTTGVHRLKEMAAKGELQAFASRCHHAGDRCHDWWQDRLDLRVRRCRQGLRFRHARCWGTRLDHGNRSHLRLTGLHGRFPGCCHGVCGRRDRHFHFRHRQF